jgi:hypothetical protein
MDELLCVECGAPATTDRPLGVMPPAEIHGHVEDGWLITELVCKQHS